MTSAWDPHRATEISAAIHAHGRQFVLACAGGGTGAIAALAQTPGASRTVLEAVVPYSAAALTAWLGAAPEQACSDATARAMAMAAWQRARRLAPEAPIERLLGAGCTASLASDRPKRGAHRVHVAVQTATTTEVRSLGLTKDARSRDEEEIVAAALVLDALGDAILGASSSRGALLAPLLLPGEAIDASVATAPQPVAALLAGRAAAACCDEQGTWRAASEFGTRRSPRALFPGAFHPLHEGHRRMAAIAAERLGRPVAFELSIANVDKPPLDFLEIAARAEQFRGAPLVLTAAPTFVEKARLAPGCVFVVGADTIARIAQPRYYGGEADRDEALAELATLGCRFLVFGRAEAERFATLGTLPLPPALSQLCDEVPEAAFRSDVSSTALRRNA
ncbi:MAG: hypothetical protein KF688_12630 [Pirellulales bacterium]|nr:hypothetical protein [Pirellulales bacterium]